VFTLILSRSKEKSRHRFSRGVDFKGIPVLRETTGEKKMKR
jgi:hypothetical protein